jgi:hypothetical protein
MTSGNAKWGLKKSIVKDTGAIFPPKDGKRSEKTPDFTGVIELSEELISGVMAQYKDSGVFKLRLIAYKNVSQAGGAYLKIYVKKDEPFDGGNKNLPKPNIRSERSEDPWD